MSAVKVDDGAMNSYSHPLAGSGKRSSRSDSSGTSTVTIETVYCFDILASVYTVSQKKT